MPHSLTLTQSNIANRKNPIFGLALGGGGARGIAHIIILEALDELGVKPAVIAGTSIGALFGAAYAAGMSAREIREHTLDVLQSRRAIFSRIMQKLPGSISELINPLTSSIFNGETVMKIVFPDQMPKTFEELVIPFHAITTDFYAQREFRISAGPLLPAVTASCALPALIQPVPYEDRILVDGGFVNPLPFDHVTKGTDFTIAIDVNGQPRSRKKKGIPRSLEVSLGVSQIMLGSLVREKLKHTRPDILVTPPVGEFLVLDFLKIRDILELCTPLKDDLKRQFEREAALHV